ncbi:MAG TPA: FAD-binding domain-containing protein [Chitinophagaceae bacterium]|nr:FAD-binding domain-containing protein [Chitinophagaceae bacterium]
MDFPANYDEIVYRIDKIDPIQYSKTRNYIDGNITYLSPYISRGVISVKQVMEAVLAKGYKPYEITKFIQELAWREYFQRVWQHLEDDMFDDIRITRTGIRHRQIPQAIITAKTGIESIDTAINDLYQTGYMHNHIRMYTASIACNIAKGHWQLPSQWMYYHLLDGDLASNTCSWQWVAGSFSSKQYFCNQENINKYTYSKQKDTIIDKSYDEIPLMEIPNILTRTSSLQLTTALPGKTKPTFDHNLPLVLYNSYNLDPLWRNDIAANRLLVLEPSHFKQYPVSEKVIRFIIELAANIDGLQLFIGEINEIPDLAKFPAIYSKEHPAFNYYPGKKDEREWMFPGVTGMYNSFFSFWKKCEQQLKNMKAIQLELIRA